MVAIAILLVAATDPRVCGDWSGGPLLFRVMWWLLYATAAIRLVQRYGLDWVRWTIAHQPTLCVLMTLAAASCLWSLDPLLTLRRAGSLLATTLLAIFIGFSRSSDALMRSVQWALAVVIAASIVVALAGYAPPEDARGWSGIMAHKNSLGAGAAVATIFFVVVTVGGRIHPLAGTVLAILSLITTVYAYSRTALIALAIPLAGAAYVRSARRTQRFTRAEVWTTAWVLALGPPVLAILVVPLASLLGDPHAVSGRGPLWAGVVTILRERPLAGYGYGAVWGRVNHTLLPSVAVTGGPSATNAHHSVLNVASELGIPAALLACVYLAGAVSNAARLFEHTASTFSCFTLLFLASFAILGFGEAHLLQIHSVFWILFVALTTAVERAHVGIAGAMTAGASQRSAHAVGGSVA